MKQPSNTARSATHQPRRLMLCHVVPDASGNPMRRSAWSTLESAARDGRVSLACLHDGPVNLAQWRELNRLVERVAIESAPRAARWLNTALRMIGTRGYVDHAVFAAPLASTVRAWQDEQPFDHVIVTHVAMARRLALAAPVQLCPLGAHDRSAWFLSQPAAAPVADQPLARAA